MLQVVTLGEILVEIMADEKGRGFREAVHLVGPFPSGAPAIFIDQVAKLGQPCGIISCVGDDDFGWLNLDRLEHDGVDVTAVEVLSGQATGSAFVRYRDSGDRDFVYNIKNSACGQLQWTDAASKLLADCRHFHVSGASLSSPQMVEMMTRAIGIVKGNGGTISFDPNIRKEVTRDPAVRSVLVAMLASCDIFLPSGDELTLLTSATTVQGAVSEILALGVTAIVVKNGPQGSTYYDADGSRNAPGYVVKEVDPTGAGDCFGATFVTCRLQGRSVEESLDYANAAGARVVGIRGPMEGTSTFAQLDALRAGAERGRRTRLGAFVSAHHKASVAEASGITSVCSAHPVVVEAVMRHAKGDTAVLVEATCNQVNHQGGYTGLTPAAFRDQVHAIADEVGFPRRQIILGGDHLGPNPWRHLPPEAALAQAEEMVAAYVAAGYEKIHLDTSMGCQGEPDHLPDSVTAERAARLAAVAQLTAAEVLTAPRFVIGTEVPVPGGAREEIKQLELTRPAAALATLEAHRQAFAAIGAEAAFEAVIALVVQPGVEFDDCNVVVYRPEQAVELSAALEQMPGLVFEAHSTDYQPPESLARLVSDGFAILKVGPALTFALREAFYGLDEIAAALYPSWAEHSFMAEMEAVMVADPGYWKSHYRGEPDHERMLRHFSYSDRIRYYWACPAAQDAVKRLFERLRGIVIPAPLISQFLPRLYSRVAGGTVEAAPRTLVLRTIEDVLDDYATACGAPRSPDGRADSGSESR
ncbi:MAG: D-tagatose-bisphosphate aldolase, class II, non-catalytic subunit [Acidimicrobiales bacterium]